MYMKEVKEEKIDDEKNIQYKETPKKNIETYENQIVLSRTYPWRKLYHYR
jgi:hypothetical protein